ARLALELAVALQPLGVELPCLDGGDHGAARLRDVAAVAEAAVAGEGGDVVEDGIEPFLVHHLQLPHPRRVQQQTAAGRSSSSRRVVVCRPRAPAGGPSAVASRASPSRALARVDLPAPEAPTRAAVHPGGMAARIESRPSLPPSALMGSTSTPGQRSSISAA